MRIFPTMLAALSALICLSLVRMGVLILNSVSCELRGVIQFLLMKENEINRTKKDNVLRSEGACCLSTQAPT